MRTGTGWSLCCTGSVAIFRGGADGRRQWAFVNLADRSPLFQQLRSRLRSRAPVSCTGSSWATGIRASTSKEADRGCRAISGPLTPVASGLSRSLTDSPLRRSGRITGPNGTASQADSAGSIPVTRSKRKAPGRRGFPDAGPSVVQRLKQGRGSSTCHWDSGQRTVSWSGLLCKL